MSKAADPHTANRFKRSMKFLPQSQSINIERQPSDNSIKKEGAKRALSFFDR